MREATTTAEQATGADAVTVQSDQGVGLVPVEGSADSEGSEGRSGTLIRHGACGKSWTGLTRGHCSKCHNTFSSGAFDKHQRIGGGVVTCSTDGLASSEQPWGTLWSMPGGAAWWGARPEGEVA